MRATLNNSLNKTMEEYLKNRNTAMVARLEKSASKRTLKALTEAIKDGADRDLSIDFRRHHTGGERVYRCIGFKETLLGIVRKGFIWSDLCEVVAGE